MAMISIAVGALHGILKIQSAESTDVVASMGKVGLKEYSDSGLLIVF